MVVPEPTTTGAVSPADSEQLRDNQRLHQGPETIDYQLPPAQDKNLTLGDQQHPLETPEAPGRPHKIPSLPTEAKQQAGLMQQLGEQQQPVTTQPPGGPPDAEAPVQPEAHSHLPKPAQQKIMAQPTLPSFVHKEPHEACGVTRVRAPVNNQPTAPVPGHDHWIPQPLPFSGTALFKTDLSRFVPLCPRLHLRRRLRLR